jgi:uncharacterized protein
MLLVSMTRTGKIVLGFGLVAVFALGVCIWSLSTSVGKISINGTELTVRLAEHSLAQKKGLSGYTEETLHEDGMLFVFSESEVRTFWMEGMQFNLDILWIADGHIVAIDRNVQAPYSRSEEPERVTSSPLEVNAVLEFPAGKVAEYGLVEGMNMKILE